MDPVSLALITAIGAGVTSSVTDATKASLVAGYTALKKRLLEKIGSLHPKVSQALAELEAAPTSQARQSVLVEEVVTAQLPHDPELLDLAQALLQQIQQTPTGSQIISHVQNSAVSNTGTAYNYNIQGDLHQHYKASLKHWEPPLMLPPCAQSFVGREEDLAWLLQRLIAGKSGVTLALCGPGGIGKTALAAEALQRLIDLEEWSVHFPDGIFYHSFYMYPSVEVAFEELVRVFGEEPRGDPRLAARRVVSRRRVLLVFDGVENLDDTRPLRELGGKNVVLVLSRRRSDAPDQAHRRDLDLLPQEQAILLLQKLAGPHAADRQSVESLVRYIGGYPLALQLIGSYLSSRQDEVRKYLKWFETKGLATINLGMHQDQSISVLLQRTYDSLTPNEQHVFLLLGLLAPAPFPLELVQAILELDEQIVWQALGSLVNLSLLRRPKQSYEVSHPLIHRFVTEYLSSQAHATSSLSPETITRWRELLLDTLTTHFEQSNSYDGAALTLWYPHVLPLVSADHLTDQQRLTAARLFNLVGFDTLTQGKYAEAEPLYQRALTICEQQLGANHPDTALSLNNLAKLYSVQGKYAEAEPLYQRALEIYELQFGQEHPLTQKVRRNYGRLLRTLGCDEEDTGIGSE